MGSPPALKLLLDTHVLLWSLLEPDRISQNVRSLMEAPLGHEVAILSRTIGLTHQDPADRFLAATAAVYDLTLVTADEHLLKGSGFSVIDCR